jgi:hypothetical protein
LHTWLFVLLVKNHKVNQLLTIAKSSDICRWNGKHLWNSYLIWQIVLTI